MTVKINSLHIENVKKVKAVVLQPGANGLTVIGGNNGEGKTSILDSIAWGLGGNRKAPTNAQRDESMTPPLLNITLSNGIKVERSGKNSALKVTDPAGAKAGQALLDSFISELALDLPKFLNQNADKAKTLLQIIGVGDELVRLDQEEKSLFQKRHSIGQIADSKKKHAAEMQEFPDVPEQPITAMELIKEQQSILAKNGENQRKRNNVNELIREHDVSVDRVIELESKMTELIKQLDTAKDKVSHLSKDIETAEKTAEQLQDESTTEIENKLNDIETTNSQIRANIDKSRALDEANEYKQQYDGYSNELEDVRKKRLELLSTANLPLPELTVKDSTLLYKDKAWDCMSGADQLKVAVAIVRRLNPNCGFVLIDKLEQMDQKTLTEFGEWLETEKLQAICTRVSTGEECSIIIEDGLPQGQSYLDVTNTPEPSPTDDDPWEQFKK